MPTHREEKWRLVGRSSKSHRKDTSLMDEKISKNRTAARFCNYAETAGASGVAGGAARGFCLTKGLATTPLRRQRVQAFTRLTSPSMTARTF